MHPERRAQLLAKLDATRAEEARAAAEAKARVDAMSARANAALLLDEYLAAGVEPPFTNGEGAPTVSLSLLLWQRWTIEQVGDANVLIAPAAPPPRARRRREDYDGSS